MARDAVPIVQGLMNNGLVSGAGVAINPANGAAIAIDGVTDRYIIAVLNTFAGAKNLTIKAGVYPPAFRQLLGDVVFACTQTTQIDYVFVESARFAQADGSIWLDFEASMTGTVWCIKLPPEMS